MKDKIMWLIVGVCVGITGVFVWWTLNLAKTVGRDDATIVQITDYLNKQIQAQQPATAPTPKK